MGVAARTDTGLDALLRAADAALVLGDAAGALTCLQRAAALVERPSEAVRVGQLTATASRQAGQADIGLGLLDQVEQRLSGDDQDYATVGALELARARIVSLSNDYAARIVSLNRAVAAMRIADDQAGLALALAELAFPVGMPVARHVTAGHEALAVAKTCGDPWVEALAACNFATALAVHGKPHPMLWGIARELTEPHGEARFAELSLRLACNWSTSLLATGDPTGARNALQAAMDEPRTPALRGMLLGRVALCLWRSGQWERARAVAEEARALSGSSYGVLALSVLDYEQSARPESAGAARLLSLFRAAGDHYWECFSAGALLRLRALRREPIGLDALRQQVRDAVLLGAMIGLGELLMEVADVAPHVARPLIDLVEADGPRTEAALEFCRGRVSGDAREARVHLLASASAFDDLGDRYASARCRLAFIRQTRGVDRDAGAVAGRAAEDLRDLGAHRSLRALLQVGHGLRSLASYRVPPMLANSGAPGLTRREQEILDQARRGLSAREIADELGIAEGTVRNHLLRLRVKVGASSKRQLVRLFD